MHIIAGIAILIIAATPTLAGQPSPTVPNRTGVGPFVSQSLDVRAAHTTPQPTGPAGLWIGNRTITGSHASQNPAPNILIPCAPSNAPCELETFSQNAGKGGK